MTRAPLLISTQNAHKLDEFRRLLDGIELRGYGEDLPATEVIEDQDTYLGNAILKAEAGIQRYSGLCLADDSGLEVDALHGAPGIHSARYVQGSDQDRYMALLNALHNSNQEERTARFRSVLVLAGLSNEDVQRVNQALQVQKIPAEQRDQFGHGSLWINDQNMIIAEGVVNGIIGDHPYGLGGFGYDPIFYLEDGRSMAAIDATEKDRWSHRGRAARLILPTLKILFDKTQSINY